MVIHGEGDARNSGETGSSPVAPTNQDAASGKGPARFAFVDGLRGFAALFIVIHHLWWFEPDPYPAFEPALWLDPVLLRFRGGVQVLLVISGFVIAYTLSNLWITPREVLSFVGRRVVRLVPAYWVTIGIVVLADVACGGLWELPSPAGEQLSVSRVLAHLMFQQDVFGHESLSAGMWTVCIEMQFYVVAVLGWALAQRLLARPDKAQPRPSAAGLLLTFAPLALASLFLWHRQESTVPWVTHFLWFFFLGMMTWWTLDRTVSLPAFLATITVVAGQLVFDWQLHVFDWLLPNAIAVVTALLIFTAGRRERLHVWLNWKWLQYLGRISYSLYLIHYTVCHLLVAHLWKWCGDHPTSAQAAAILGVSLLASIAAGHLLYLAVEAPSARWAARMKREPKVATPQPTLSET